MKKLLLGAAVSAALFGAVANAAVIKIDDGSLAYTASHTPDLTKPTAVIYLGGSSALDEVIVRTLQDTTSSASVCKANAGVTTAQLYVDGPTFGKDQYAIYCTLNTGNTTVNSYIQSTGNTRLLLLKRSNGGSALGVVPTLTATKVEFLNLTSSQSACTNGATDAIIKSTNAIACPYANQAAATPNNTLAVPNFGAADVSLNIFSIASNNLPVTFNIGSTPLPAFTAAAVTNAIVFPGTAQTFGIAVTTSLRNALQEAQFGHGSSRIGSELAADMPSLSSHQLADIFAAYPAPQGTLSSPVKGAGKFGDWTQFKLTDTSVTPSVVTDLFSYSTDAKKPSSSKLHICGRTVGSGTKATLGAVLLGNGCKTAAESNTVAVRYDYQGTDEPTQTAAPVLYNSTPVAETSVRPTVHTLSSGGGVAECLDELYSGNVASLAGGSFAPGQYYGTSGLTTGTDAAATRWAIGYLAVNTNKDNSKGFRFIKIDGAEPTLQNVANGSYPLWTESTYFYTKTSVGAGKVGTSNTTLINSLITSLTTPTVLSFVNSNTSQFTWGLSGNLAIPTATLAANLDGSITSTPVNPLSYAVYPGTGKSATDDCRNPVVYANTSSATAGTTTVGTPNTAQALLLK